MSAFRYTLTYKCKYIKGFVVQGTDSVKSHIPVTAVIAAEMSKQHFK